MQYIEIENGKIKNHFSGAKIPKGTQYKEVSNDFNGLIGMDIKFLDFKNSGKVKSNKILISEGLIEDNIGIYYDKVSKQKYEIKELNIRPNENWTKEKPLNVPYEVFNGKIWIEDPEKKAEYEKHIKYNEAQSILYTTDWYIIRKMETGKEIPVEILESRESARLELSELK